MLNLIKDLLRAPVRFIKSRIFGLFEWKQRGFEAPAPQAVKLKVLLRNATPNATWVETGTYLGETTRVLARSAAKVFSVEPEPKLFSRATKKFAGTPNVTILHGTSEAVLPSLLPSLSGAVNFWLDGHYSAGITFEGVIHTPVIEELANIERYMTKLGRVCVLVDDVRCFNPSLPEYASYPSLDALVDWARRNGLKWHIEHDIFVAVTMGVSV